TTPAAPPPHSPRPARPARPPGNRPHASSQPCRPPARRRPRPPASSPPPRPDAPSVPRPPRTPGAPSAAPSPARAPPPRRRTAGTARQHASPRHGEAAMTSDTASQIAYLARVLKAPALRDSAERLAATARENGWTHAEYLAACLEAEVATRSAHGAANRIRAAGFPARKNIEDFEFRHQRAV